MCGRRWGRWWRGPSSMCWAQCTLSAWPAGWCSPRCEHGWVGWRAEACGHVSAVAGADGLQRRGGPCDVTGGWAWMSAGAPVGGSGQGRCRRRRGALPLAPRQPTVPRPALPCPLQSSLDALAAPALLAFLHFLPLLCGLWLLSVQVWARDSSAAKPGSRGFPWRRARSQCTDGPGTPMCWLADIGRCHFIGGYTSGFSLNQWGALTLLAQGAVELRPFAPGAVQGALPSAAITGLQARATAWCSPVGPRWQLMLAPHTRPRTPRGLAAARRAVQAARQL